MQTRHWKAFGAVIDGIRHEAYRTAQRANAIAPLANIPYIARWQERLWFRSMMQVRYAERLLVSQSQREIAWIMDRVQTLLRPRVLLMLSLFSPSHTAFAIRLVSIAVDRYVAARTINREQRIA